MNEEEVLLTEARSGAFSFRVLARPLRQLKGIVPIHRLKEEDKIQCSYDTRGRVEPNARRQHVA